MKRITLLLTTALSAFAFSLLGQTTVTFDAPLLLPAATQFYTNQYIESGMLFKPLGIPGTGDLIFNSGDLPDFPENGTQYLQTHGVFSVEFLPVNGGEFDLQSIELAEYSTSFAFSKNVTFVGYKRIDHRTITMEKTVVLDGIIDGDGPLADFQRFTFDRHWRQVQRVQIKSDFNSISVDNVVVSRGHGK